MKVLIACEFSATLREAFKARGHDAWSCDILPTEIEGQHVQGDVLKHLQDVGAGYYDLIIAHPPCTYLTNAGVRWLFGGKGTKVDHLRWSQMQEGCWFFNQFRQYADKVVCENPIPHKYAVQRIGMYDQIIHPWQFGHTERKATCLWIKGLPKLKHTKNVKAEMELLPKKETSKIHYASPGPDRWKVRSKSYQGIADAMADQWG